MTIEDKIDPLDYPTETAFKRAVYDEFGSGSWIEDMKLEIVYKEAHGKPFPDYLQPLMKEE